MSVHLKHSLEPSNLATRSNKREAVSKSKVIQRPGKLQRRDITAGETIPKESIIEEVEEKGLPEIGPPFALPKPPVVKPLIKPNETEAERAERIHKSFERLLTFVEIVGQVDNYFSSKWKNLVRTVSNFYEVEDEPYRLGAKRVYGTCPHAH